MLGTAKTKRHLDLAHKDHSVPYLCPPPVEARQGFLPDREMERYEILLNG
jgi:hypothetical protein